MIAAGAVAVYYDYYFINSRHYAFAAESYAASRRHIVGSASLADTTHACLYLLAAVFTLHADAIYYLLFIYCERAMIFIILAATRYHSCTCRRHTIHERQLPYYRAPICPPPYAMMSLPQDEYFYCKREGRASRLCSC